MHIFEFIKFILPIYLEATFANYSATSTSKHLQKFNQTDYTEPAGQCRLLLVSLLDNFCSMYDKNPSKNRKLFTTLCQKLTSMGILKSLDFLDDSESIRSVYRDAFKNIVLDAVHNIEMKELHRVFNEDEEGSGLSRSSPVPSNKPSEDYEEDLIDQKQHKQHTFSHFLNNSTTTGDSMITPVSLIEDISLSGRSRYQEDFVEGGILGRGGYGKVVVATNKLDGNSYAIKKIHFSGVSSTRFSRILREVKSLAHLDHPNIVRYNSAWIEDHSVILEKIESSEDGCSGETKNVVHELNNSKYEAPILSSSSSSESEDCNDDSDTFTSGTSSTSDCDTFYSTSKNNEESDVTHIFHAPSSETYSTSAQSRHTTSVYSQSRFYLQDRKIMYIQMELCRFNLEQYIKARNKFYFECLDEFKATGRLPDNRRKIFFRDKKDRPHIVSAEKLFSFNRTGEGSMELTLNPTELDHIFKGIVKGLNYIHENGMIHRDLKPLNIFFHHDLSPKIGDFGLVSEIKCSCGYNCSIVEKIRIDDLVEAEADEEGNCRSGATTPLGSCPHTKGVGTITYASPEQLSQEEYSQKSDIYSLGIICFELFYPVATQMERTRVLSDLKHHHKFPESFLKQWPKEAAFIWSCIARDSDLRPSADEILDSEWLERDHEEIISKLETELSAARKREDELLRAIEALKSENSVLKVTKENI